MVFRSLNPVLCALWFVFGIGCVGAADNNPYSLKSFAVDDEVSKTMGLPIELQKIIKLKEVELYVQHKKRGVHGVGEFITDPASQTPMDSDVLCGLKAIEKFGYFSSLLEDNRTVVWTLYQNPTLGELTNAEYADIDTIRRAGIAVGYKQASTKDILTIDYIKYDYLYNWRTGVFSFRDTNDQRKYFILIGRLAHSIGGKALRASA